MGHTILAVPLRCGPGEGGSGPRQSLGGQFASDRRPPSNRAACMCTVRLALVQGSPPGLSKDGREGYSTPTAINTPMRIKAAAESQRR